MVCRTRIPVAFASASFATALLLLRFEAGTAFDVCFVGWCDEQVGSVQTFRISPLSMPSVTIASVVYLHALNSGHFAFSGVSGFSSLISTYLLRGIAFSPPGCCL